MKGNAKPISYTNRKGKTYYLHSAVRKSGNTVLAMKTCSKGALSELPDGYVITENVNGQVSVGRFRPRQISEQEEALVAQELERLGLNHCRCVAKDACLTVYEPLHSPADLSETAEALGAFCPAQTVSWISRKLDTGPLEPVMRFQLIDKDRRHFNVERMTYRGDGGWRSLWDEDTLARLAAKYLPHIGKDSLFELI